MTKPKSALLGTEPIGKLLQAQAIPASIGILIMSIYMIVDTIFVGHYVNGLGIGAITVVMPITFLIASVGMAIGVGGASMISRALGAKDGEMANRTFANQVSLTLTLAIGAVAIGSFFETEVLALFGAKAGIVPYAEEYFQVVLWGVPFLAWAMMTNHVIRSVGASRMAMLVMIIPAIANIVLDPIFIIGFDMGMRGAALATVLSYVASAGFGGWFLLSGKSELRLLKKFIPLQRKIVAEIISIGGVSLVRQGVVSLLYIVMNHTLFSYGGENAVSVFGIIARLMMFANFPVLGVAQGFLPIAGYNFGAGNWERVRAAIRLSLLTGTALSLLTFAGILLFPHEISALFSNEQMLLDQTGPAILIVFMATPLITLQLIGAVYYQAIGKPLPALLLTLSKQGFFLIPLILILPNY
ncbi:MAG TPA: MATE family efflux transporter, partial [Bacteroidetes bacterium]|nr:MATE family efflux transporter [Bacteroidota bacterium]